MSHFKEGEALFAMIRQQFLDDPEENMDKLHELAQRFVKSPNSSVSQMLLALHNIKGSAQAVGFLQFADMVHRLEDAIGGIKKLPSDISMLEKVDKVLHQIIEALSYAFQQMSRSHSDADITQNDFLALLDELTDLAKAEEDASQAIAAQAAQGWGLFDDSEKKPQAYAPASADARAPASALAHAYAPATAPAPAQTLADAATPPPASAATQATAHQEKPVVARSKPAVETEDASAPVKDMKFLLMEQSEQFFAVSIDDVKEIISKHFVNPLPDVQSGLKGMIVVRDRTLPVLDLGEVFGMSKTNADQEDTSCAVICESQNQCFAFRVEKPRQVISLAAKDFESVEAKLGQHVRSHLIKRIARFNGHSVLVIDLQTVLKAS